MIGLRAAQTVYAYIAHIQNLSCDKEQALRQVKALLTDNKGAWEAALRLWRSSSNGGRSSELSENVQRGCCIIRVFCPKCKLLCAITNVTISMV